MPRQKSLLTVIRAIAQQEVRAAVQSLLASVPTRKRATPGRCRRRLGTRPRTPGSWVPGRVWGKTRTWPGPVDSVSSG